MKKGTTCFLVWTWDGDDPESGYYTQYETLEEAVKCETEPVEVFEAKLTRLGRFSTKVSIVKAWRKK